MAYCWHADDDPILNAGLVAFWIFRGAGAVLLRNPIFCDFQEAGGRDPLSVPPSSGSAHAILAQY